MRGFVDREFFFSQAILTNSFFPANFKDRVLSEFPKFRIMEKHDAKNLIVRFSRFVFSILKKITGRDMRYDLRTTTLGYTIFLGSDWRTRTRYGQWALIRHELQHCRQWKKWWIFYPISYILNIWSVLIPVVTAAAGGAVWVAIVGAIGSLAMPAGLSMRGVWEFQAFKETLAAGASPAIDYVWTPDELADYYTGLLTDFPYFFALTFAAPLVRRRFRAWIDKLGVGKR